MRITLRAVSHLDVEAHDAGEDEHMRDQRIGTRAAIRVEPGNHASIRVAEKCGFDYVHDFTSATDKQPDGSPARMRLYVHEV